MWNMTFNENSMPDFDIKMRAKKASIIAQYLFIYDLWLLTCSQDSCEWENTWNVNIEIKC